MHINVKKTSNDHKKYKNDHVSHEKNFDQVPLFYQEKRIFTGRDFPPGTKNTAFSLLLHAISCRMRPRLPVDP